MTDKEIFYYWVQERLSILEKRMDGLSKPWTDDPILRNYRFCNVKREDDTVTKWIKNNWRDPYNDNPNMPLAMVIARTCNWPETLEEIGFPSEDADYFEFARETMKRRRTQGQKVWTGAYLVSTNGVPMDKIDYIIDRVWKPVDKDLRLPHEEERLETYWSVLRQFDGLGSFIAAQVVCDLKYTRWLKDAPDWWSWAALGPGSIRGLNRYMGRPIGTLLRQEDGRQIMLEQQATLEEERGIRLHLQDVQNCNCEYDKYLRVLHGEGKPRSRYNG